MITVQGKGHAARRMKLYWLCQFYLSSSFFLTKKKQKVKAAENLTRGQNLIKPAIFELEQLRAAVLNKYTRKHSAGSLNVAKSKISTY
jgi:hypothetical protein